MARNYRSEYDNYHGKQEQIDRRSSRNKAHRKKNKKGQDTHHKDGNPMNNSRSNLAIISKSRNRSRKA